MTIPKLKRIKISSERELRNRLAKNSDDKQEVMLVTCNKKSPDKYITSERIHHALKKHGWIVGSSYTLKGNLVGHVASHV